MVLRKITYDNSVKDVPITEKKQSKKIQSISRGSKQNKIYSKNNNKKFLKNLAASGFGKLTKQYFVQV